MKKNKLAIIPRIMVLSIIVAESSIITSYLMLYGSIEKLSQLGEMIYGFLTLTPLLLSLIGIGPGRILIMMMFIFPIFLWTLGLDLYYIIIGPVSLSFFPSILGDNCTIFPLNKI